MALGTNPQIRLAAPADAARLAELAARTFRDTFAATNDPSDMAAHLAKAYGVAQQAGEIADLNVTTLLVDLGGDLVGYAQLRFGSTPDCVTGSAPIELWRFYIVQEWQGRGIAAELMREVHAAAHRSGARTVWLGVWEHNERAKAFYRKCQFVDVGSHIFTVGQDAQVDRILVRSVGLVAAASS